MQFSLQSFLKPALLLVTLLLAGASTQAANYIVTSAADTDTGTCDEANTSDTCTLRKAIEVANADPETGDTIFFADSVNGAITLTKPLPVVTSIIVINGFGLVLDGKNGTRLLEVSYPGHLTLKLLRLQNGIESGAKLGGGAIHNSSGTVIAMDCNFAGNIARGGGAIYNQGDVRGGLLVLSDCNFTGNKAARRGSSASALGGGAIANLSGTVKLTNCSLSSNIIEGNESGGGLGGAIFTSGGEFTLSGCMMQGNKAMNRGFNANKGGAIYNSSSKLSLENCTLIRNHSLSYQAPRSTPKSQPVFFPGRGGAIAADGYAMMKLTNCTLNDNSVYGIRTDDSAVYRDDSRSGGAIYNIHDKSVLILQNCTLSNNLDTTTGLDPAAPGISTLVNGGKLTVRNTAFVTTDSKPFDGFEAPRPGGDDNKNFAFGSTEAAGLDALNDNGDPVPTMALLPNSPLLDVGLSRNAPLTDARREPRPHGDGIDVGAYELYVPDTPMLSVSDVSVIERDSGTQNLTFTVTLFPAAYKTVTVTATPNAATAIAPSDFINRAATLTFAPGETVKTFEVPVVGDKINEATETFDVLLSESVNAAIARVSATATISDNDTSPSISVDDITVQEGNEDTRVAIFTLKLSSPGLQVVKVSYATANGTAKANSLDVGGTDYGALPSTEVAFAAGQTTLQVRVVIICDEVDEPNETFFLNLSTPINAAIADNQAKVTLIDDDPPASISVNSVNISEGNPTDVSDGVIGMKFFTFAISMTGRTAYTTSIKFTTVNGTAITGSAAERGDYIATNGAITFSSNGSGKPLTNLIRVPINGDTIAERDETFYILLSSPENAVIGIGRGTGTIVNDDAGRRNSRGTIR